MKHVHMCPATVRMPTINGSQSALPNFCAANVGRKPFRKSQRNARMPHGFPTVRYTFVAPMFFDPSVRMSFPRSFPMRKPNGMEPTRYAPTAQRIQITDLSIDGYYTKTLRVRRGS